MMVSHELKNNMLILRRLIESALYRPQALKELSSALIENTNRPSEFVDILLSLAKSGKLIGEKQNVDVKNIAEEIFKNCIEEHIPAELQIEKEMPLLWCDMQGIRQVISNLIRNSIDNRDSSKPALIMELKHHDRGSHIELVFRDNGKGMPKSCCERVFDYAFSTKEKRDSGLGLAIVKKIVEAHGGSVRAHSEGDGKGSEFIIELPAAVTC